MSFGVLEDMDHIMFNYQIAKLLWCVIRESFDLSVVPREEFVEILLAQSGRKKGGAPSYFTSTGAAVGDENGGVKNQHQAPGNQCRSTWCRLGCSTCQCHIPCVGRLRTFCHFCVLRRMVRGASRSCTFLFVVSG
jgi:hypothetical protein